MITMMFASDENGLIGDGDKMPWHISSDFKHFKKYTTGKNIAMGRKTAQLARVVAMTASPISSAPRDAAILGASPISL